MSQEANTFLTCKAHYDSERLRGGVDFEFWFYKCRSAGAKLIQAGVACDELADAIRSGK